MLGVFSDSLGDLEALEAAYALLCTKGARRFFFAGGQYADLDAWLEWRAAQAIDRRGGEGALEGSRRLERFVRTPERASAAYRDPTVARKSVEMGGDVLCCLAHDKNELDREDLLNARVFIHGRTSEPRVVQIGPRYFLSPGPLSGGSVVTCGLLELEERNLCFSAFTLDGRILLDRQPLMLERRAKLRVK